MLWPLVIISVIIVCKHAKFLSYYRCQYLWHLIGISLFGPHLHSLKIYGQKN